MTTLCIIPCGKSKIWDNNPSAGPTPASEVYTGHFVRACQRYATTFYPDSWCILSARHGFLFPTDTVPGHYDVSFIRPASNPISLDQLRAQARDKGLFAYDPIIAVTTKAYAEIICQVFSGAGITVRTPLRGRGGMGSMMSALKQARETGAPL